MLNVNFKSNAISTPEALLFGTMLIGSFWNRVSDIDALSNDREWMRRTSIAMTYVPYIAQLAEEMGEDHWLGGNAFTNAVRDAVCVPFCAWIKLEINSSPQVPDDAACRNWLRNAMTRLVSEIRSVEHLACLHGFHCLVLSDDVEMCAFVLQQDREHGNPDWGRAQWRNSGDTGFGYWRWVVQRADTVLLQLFNNKCRNRKDVFADLLHANAVSTGRDVGVPIVVRRDLVAQELLESVPDQVTISATLIDAVPHALDCLDAMALSFDRARWEGRPLFEFMDLYSVANDPDATPVIQFRVPEKNGDVSVHRELSLRALWNAVPVEGAWRLATGERLVFHSAF